MHTSIVRRRCRELPVLCLLLLGGGTSCVAWAGFHDCVVAFWYDEFPLVPTAISTSRLSLMFSIISMHASKLRCVIRQGGEISREECIAKRSKYKRRELEKTLEDALLLLYASGYMAVTNSLQSCDRPFHDVKRVLVPWPRIEEIISPDLFSQSRLDLYSTLPEYSLPQVLPTVWAMAKHLVVITSRYPEALRRHRTVYTEDHGSRFRGEESG